MENVDICHPSMLLEKDQVVKEPWICVQTRPRWEKKFSKWLEAHQQAHFLPLTRRRTISHRKVRITQTPLFPGYVFVNTRSTARGVMNSPCVVRTLTPANDSENQRLATQIVSVYRLLKCQGVVDLHPQLVEGQWVRLSSGPLAGTVGQFIGTRNQRKLLLRVDMLGVGASVNLPITADVEPL